MSIRSHIHLRMSGVIERAYGTFVWQNSDQMQATTFVQEVEERDWLARRDKIWSDFVKWEPSGA
jgi:hypothetical protein